MNERHSVTGKRPGPKLQQTQESDRDHDDALKIDSVQLLVADRRKIGSWDGWTPQMRTNCSPAEAQPGQRELQIDPGAWTEIHALRPST